MRSAFMTRSVRMPAGVPRIASKGRLVGIDEGAGLRSEAVPIDLIGQGRRDFPAQERRCVGGIAQSSLEELVVGLVDRLL